MCMSVHKYYIQQAYTCIYVNMSIIIFHTVADVEQGSRFQITAITAVHNLIFSNLCTGRSIFSLRYNTHMKLYTKKKN